MLFKERGGWGENPSSYVERHNLQPELQKLFLPSGLIPVRPQPRPSFWRNLVRPVLISLQPVPLPNRVQVHGWKIQKKKKSIGWVSLQHVIVFKHDHHQNITMTEQILPLGAGKSKFGSILTQVAKPHRFTKDLVISNTF